MTDELKKTIENAKTEEDMKGVAEEFKDEMKKLSDEELDGVAGGTKKIVGKPRPKYETC